MRRGELEGDHDEPTRLALEGRRSGRVDGGCECGAQDRSGQRRQRFRIVQAVPAAGPSRPGYLRPPALELAQGALSQAAGPSGTGRLRWHLPHRTMEHHLLHRAVPHQHRAAVLCLHPDQGGASRLVLPGARSRPGAQLVVRRRRYVLRLSECRGRHAQRRQGGQGTEAGPLALGVPRPEAARLRRQEARRRQRISCRRCRRSWSRS